MRKYKLCEGEQTCPYSTCECCECGHVWKPDDPKYAAECPSCGHGFHEKLRCEHSIEKEGGCPLTLLENSIDINPDTSILEDVSDLQMQLALEFSVSLDTVRADVWPALKILKEEQDRLEREPKT